MSDLLSTMTDAVGWAVLHFLWQGIVIGIVAWAMMAASRRRGAAARHGVALVALTGCAAAFLLTFAFELAGRPVAGDLSLGSQAPSGSDREWVVRIIPLVAALWACGAAFVAIRAGRQWLGSHRLKTRGIFAPDERWLVEFASLSRDLGLRRVPRLLRSAIVDVPMVIGCVSLAVLVPSSAFASLSSDQLRAVLAHELSHIRRGDHWINSVQVAIETILFFHPAVWWLSGQIRLEREHCCDDVAVRSVGSPKVLAEALLRLETLRSRSPVTALSSNGGLLMNRIERMLAAPHRNALPTFGWVPATVLVSAFAIVSLVGIAQDASPKPTAPDAKSAPMKAEVEKLAAVLKDKVAAGEITAEQAKAKMAAFQAQDPKWEAKAGPTKADIEKMGMSLRAKVAAGEMTPEQAKQKMAAFQNQEPKAEAKAGPTQADIEKMGMSLRAKVAAGEITPEQAKQKMAAFQNQEPKADAKVDPKPDPKAAPTQADYDRAERILKARVAAGEVSAEDAAKRLAGIKERMNPPPGR